MRKCLLLLMLMVFPAVAVAGPYAFALRVEHVWNEELSGDWGKHCDLEWEDTDIAGSFIPSLELSEYVFLTGRATRFFAGERNEFAVGIEYRFSTEAAPEPCVPAKSKKPCKNCRGR